MVSITLDQMRRFARTGRPDILAAVAAGEAVLSRYDITTPGRLCHFMAQIAHESDGFRTTEEYASGAAYEGRKDLGNVRNGDGTRFKGRGLIQLTGRANYRVYGERLGVDLEARPARAAAPDFSLLVACEYWKDKGLNAFADRDDIVGITKRINGGTNGLADRKAKLSAAKAIWGAETVAQPDDGAAVKALQQDLVALGYDLEVDGDLGKKTKAAVEAVQRRAGIKVDGIAGPATKSAIARLLAARPATGVATKIPGALDALKTKEGMATAGTVGVAVLNAAANPGPLGWFVGAAILIAAGVAAYYFLKRMRREEVV